MKGSIIETINLLSKINFIITPSRQQNRNSKYSDHGELKGEKNHWHRKDIEFLHAHWTKTPGEWIHHNLVWYFLLNDTCSVFCSDQLKLKHSNLKKSTTCPDPLSRYYPWVDWQCCIDSIASKSLGGGCSWDLSDSDFGSLSSNLVCVCVSSSLMIRDRMPKSWSTMVKFLETGEADFLIGMRQIT